MKNKLSKVEERIRDKNRKILLISGFSITLISFISFFSRYNEKRDECTEKINSLANYRAYCMKLDPNEVLSHTGLGILIFAMICATLIIFNHYYLNRHSNSVYLLKRIPRKNYYFQCIAKYPLKHLLIMFIINALLEWLYISYTLNNDVSLINPLCEVNYLRLLF